MSLEKADDSHAAASSSLMPVACPCVYSQLPSDNNSVPFSSVNLAVTLIGRETLSLSHSRKGILENVVADFNAQGVYLIVVYVFLPINIFQRSFSAGHTFVIYRDYINLYFYL